MLACLCRRTIWTIIDESFAVTILIKEKKTSRYAAPRSNIDCTVYTTPRFRRGDVTDEETLGVSESGQLQRGSRI